MLAHGRKGDPLQVLRRVLAAALLGALAAPLPAAAVTNHRSPRASRAIKIVAVKTGIPEPTGFTFSPSGRIWYVEKTSGEVHILNPSTGRDRRFMTISNVDGSGERGALGIALHPAWPAKAVLYVYVTRTDHGVLVNELLRIRDTGGSPGGTRVLFRWAVTGATNHNGGRIAFGPDGMLYVVTGENADPANSQQKANLRGKILRLRPNGKVPADNPFGTRIWSFGHRNSFGFAFDPGTGRLWETENGPSCNDEINLIRKGGNYAWGPHEACGSLAPPKDTNRDGPSPRLLPKTYFRSTLGITGAAFCDACGLGAALDGDLLFGQVNAAQLWHADLDVTRTAVTGRSVILTLSTVIYSMEVGPNRRVYFSGPNGIYRLASA